ncbi:zinc finger, RING/FYVE/PHD-type [Artemisia annua]|uniref:Zinc finger, RING/FYVE/PHD-type n=1 Tax=Artemisia annua TaxID=35608 RepID=A0A2U1NQ86_ARTAN|nr:zinc finger, RING/FYVE/PHD-type [Artemisia annua]
MCRAMQVCDHFFHAECVDTWLVKVPSCPICRRVVRMEDEGLSGDEECRFLWAIGVGRQISEAPHIDVPYFLDLLFLNLVSQKCVNNSKLCLALCLTTKYDPIIMSQIVNIHHSRLHQPNCEKKKSIKLKKITIPAFADGIVELSYISSCEMCTSGRKDRPSRALSHLMTIGYMATSGTTNPKRSKTVVDCTKKLHLKEMQ